MTCPSCESKSLVQGSLEAGLPAMTCSKCGGYWVGAEDYRAWLARRRVPEKPKPADAVAIADAQHARLCPSCGRIMLRYRVGHGVDFFLDTCGMCNGIWFDHNEWTALKGRNLHDDLHLIFTEPWQAEVHREGARKHREALYRKRYGADYDDLMRLHAWLREHPHRTSILALLADPEPFEP